MSQPTRYDTFNQTKDYKRVITIGGRQDQDWDYNLLEAIQDNEREALGDQIFQKSAILSGLTASSLNNGTGAAVLNSGTIYLDGRAEPVAGATLSYGATVAVNNIYVEWVHQRITKVQDTTLVDPNTLSPVFETDQVLVSLASSTPDILDEDFYTFQSGVPYNSRLAAPWVLNSGTITQGAPAEGYSTFALQMNYTAGTATTVTSPTFTVAPSTTYYLYFYTKTVYGQTDLLGGDGAFAKVNIAVPNTTVFATSGGTTLLGGYTQTAITFTTGVSDTSATLAFSIPSTASSSTQILISNVLLTTSPLTSTPQQYERHYYHIYTWNRPTTPTVLTPVVTPKSVLDLSDFGGSLNATQIIFTPDGGTAPDITAGTVESAIDQLSTQRALLAGASTQIFNVADAATLTEAPSAKQVQDGSLIWGGTSTNIGNAYTITLPISPTFVVGMQIRFIANATNTGPATISINGTLFNINRNDGSQTQSHDILSGAIIILNVESLGATNFCFLYTPPPQFATQNGAQNFADDVGAANAYVVTIAPTPIAITEGFPLRVAIANTNTGASTLTVNGTLYTMKRPTGNDLVPNDLLGGGIFEFVFDGTFWQLVSVPGNVLQTQEIFGVKGGTRGRLQLATNVTIGSTPTGVLAVSLTMPSTGVAWAVNFHTHMWTQMLAPTDTSGSTVDVQTQITDGTVTETVSEGYELCTNNNQTKKLQIHGPWSSPSYSPGTVVTFTLQAVANISGTAPQPVALAGSSTYLQWVILSSS